MPMTIKDLKKILDKYPDDMPVGVVGHFGELWNLNQYNFSEREAYIVPEWKSWRTTPNRPMVKVLQIETPDIGPDPD